MRSDVKEQKEKEKKEHTKMANMFILSHTI